MKTNASQILRENYNGNDNEFESLHEYVKRVSESDSSFFRWFFDNENLQYFECQDVEFFKNFLNECNDCKKIASFPEEIEDYSGDMGAHAIASFDKFDLDLPCASRDDVAKIDITSYIYEYDDKYYLEILTEGNTEQWESSRIDDLQKIATDETYKYIVDELDSFVNLDSNEFKSIECESIEDFISNAEIGQKWQDENGDFHYKTRYQNGNAESFHYNEDGDVVVDEIKMKKSQTISSHNLNNTTMAQEQTQEQKEKKPQVEQTKPEIGSLEYLENQLMYTGFKLSDNQKNELSDKLTTGKDFTMRDERIYPETGGRTIMSYDLNFKK
jgi:hypothetical protein